jgi:sulfite oxidase
LQGYCSSDTTAGFTLCHRADTELQVMSADGDVKSFTLEELKTKFPKASVTATLQCAGNRRSEMGAVREVKGLFWTTAISTAEWSGVSLRDLLKEVNAAPSEDAQHIQFQGLDSDMRGEFCYLHTTTMIPYSPLS